MYISDIYCCQDLFDSVYPVFISDYCLFKGNMPHTDHEIIDNMNRFHFTNPKDLVGLVRAYGSFYFP